MKEEFEFEADVELTENQGILLEYQIIEEVEKRYGKGYDIKNWFSKELKIKVFIEKEDGN